jgi:hypothetical protein
MKLSDLKRNDVPGALAYAKARIAEKGYLPPDEAKILASLQDDPDALFAELKKILPRPT